MRKKLQTLGVVGAYSGRLLKERGFGEIHEVFDHLYPGIMTVGVAAMSDDTKKYLGQDVPALLEIPSITKENFEEVAAWCLDRFGPEIDVEGPIKDINPSEVELEHLKKLRPDMPVVTVPKEAD